MTDGESSNSAAFGYTGAEVFLARRRSRGRVQRFGIRLSLDEAVRAREVGSDVVVCGPRLVTNLLIAQTIEARATNNRHMRHKAHRHAGPHALSHFQPIDRASLAGHTFYEDPPHRMAQ